MESTYDRVFSDRQYAVIEKSAYFKHFVIEHFTTQNSDELHIYIDGDGSPWIAEQPARDPTPHNPLALELMSQDTSNSIYLGRPCYFNHYAQGEDARCDARYWTNARYSQTVIDDMNAIVRFYIGAKNPRHIVLIGYSGGGVVATMMACALPKPITLITLAANLDTGQWATLHNYSPLLLSVNPANAFSRCAGLTQHHFAGSEDKQVPAVITQTFTNRFNAPLTILPNTDHACCWVEQWQKLLASVLEQQE